MMRMVKFARLVIGFQICKSRELLKFYFRIFLFSLENSFTISVFAEVHSALSIVYNIIKRSENYHPPFLSSQLLFPLFNSATI